MIFIKLYLIYFYISACGAFLRRKNLRRSQKTLKYNHENTRYFAQSTQGESK